MRVVELVKESINQCKTKRDLARGEEYETQRF